MDSYQAIYDAVRSRISGGNIGEAVADVARQSFDISMTVASLGQAFHFAADEHAQTAREARRPFVLLKPKLYPDGNAWCALYGENIQEGVAGFGETPEKAAQAFDLAWLNSRANAKSTSTDEDQA
jgi:hypothetical protein